MSSIARAILLAVLSCPLVFGQQHNAVQHVIVNLPDNVNSEDVFIRYQIITDKGGDGNLVKRSPGVRQFVLSVASSLGGTPEIANIVMYSPGCQFKIYVLDVRGPEGPVQQFTCEFLQTKHIVGRMPVDEIPKNLLYKKDSLVEVTASLNADWICDYFLRPRPDIKDQQFGSCLSAPVSIGIVGTVDPSKGGFFEIDVPDFTRDPTFREARTESYGVVALSLRDRTTGQVLASLKRRGNNRPENSGLEVSVEYPEPIDFTAIRVE